MAPDKLELDHLRSFVEKRARCYSASGPLRDRIVQASIAAAAVDLNLVGGMPVEKAICLVIHRVARLELGLGPSPPSPDIPEAEPE
jgi:hypothetical protein